MIGPLINGAAILIGGGLGIALRRFIPQRLQDGLPPAFAMVSIAMGVTLVVKVQQLPAVALAIIIGVAVGELCRMEYGVQRAGIMIQRALSRVLPTPEHRLPQDVYTQNFTALIMLFCASGTGVVGALTEGLSGDYQLLIIKSALDIFTALIFSISLGFAVMSIAIPQLIIQALLFFSAKLIMPFMTVITLGDFSACGGLIMIAVGLRIAQIKLFAVVNFLPALLLVIPISLYWHRFFG
ncbi:DUF554 domain-containing protein [Brenneria goodwinii]|uniref:Putative inner membrane protein n=1 Tax=Brenneria goodwinii TaxID=1109412 RepID=A0A0G4JP53_9GAMM|nr:DUF554 domain-containing protein [Brenneria goodwinii]MCG8156854.1 DUF554 domain-containing protein [Brenneria goodwinii]MCG8163496.1 DUF554 domain-containing protein [Brenneria goodwinii]MCG8165672.1 DUF554 domain-containing protein [Brenneria goodwinii]MCG8170160.1 DUF554 domain-containing protein [Brenneria goodwinii]MCG8174370.1 DUF554 domain-containing protein [Brenneria goodwinii]